MDEYPRVVQKQKRDWWKRGRAFDLWSIPHFLFGVFTAMVPGLTGVSLFSAFILTIALALLWELYEKIIGIRERTLNSVADVVLPILAFTGTSFALRAFPLHPQTLLVVAIAVFLIYLFTNISGWLAYRRRNHDFIH
ncbi:hypothetical protein EXS57_03540 [Candidatus Kaiserbacteria bacterium]|nr:hypothetical protein [Candidatus Kaiserbacteria bacterium]